MIEAAREGHSTSLLVHGEAGMGTTTLLRDAPTGPRHARAAGARDRVGVGATVRHALGAAVAAARPRSEIPSVRRRRSTTPSRFEGGTVIDRFRSPPACSACWRRSRAPAGAGRRRRPPVARQGIARALLYAARRLDAEGVVCSSGSRRRGRDAAELGLDRIRSPASTRPRAGLLTAEPSDGAAVIDQLLAASAGDPLALRESRTG